MTTRRRGFEAVDPAGTRERRIFVGATVVVHMEGGGSQTYAAGEFYMVPEALATKWIEADAAYDPEDPARCPSCDVTATEFRLEGGTLVGPRAAMARHVAKAHQQAEAAPVAQTLVSEPEPPAPAAEV